jgi:hypothetical protein
MIAGGLGSMSVARTQFLTALEAFPEKNLRPRGS